MRVYHLRTQILWLEDLSKHTESAPTVVGSSKSVDLPLMRKLAYASKLSRPMMKNWPRILQMLKLQASHLLELLQ